MFAVTAVAAIVSAPAMASTPRELLTTAAFQTQRKAQALTLIGQAIAESDRILATRANDREATLQRAVAIGYRAKLTRGRADARTSLRMFEQLLAQYPNDPEMHMVVAGWHLDAIDQLGALVARTGLGAKGDVGETALARGVSLGEARAFYSGIGALMQIRKNPRDVALAKRWAEAASVGQTLTPLDVIMKRAAQAILPALRANDGQAAARIAKSLLPFGRLTN